MAALDSSVPHKLNTETVTLEDGTPNSLVLNLKQGVVTWTATGRTAVEARETDRHEATPVLVETGDGNVTGSFTFLVTSWLGDTAVTPYEMLTFTGGASGYTSTATGSRKVLKMTVTYNSTEDGGGSQTAVFAYLDVNSIDVGEQDGLLMITANFTDHENYPTVA